MNEFVFMPNCFCAGSGCSGHFMISPEDITLIGYQGAARHTWTPGCDGFHESAQCPGRSKTA